MNGPIIKIERNGVVRYFFWSTIGQGPSMGYTLEQLHQVYEEEFGRAGLRKLVEERLPRVEKSGCSSMVDTVESLMEHCYEDELGQRALSVEELWERYVEGDLCERCFRATKKDELDADGNCRREVCLDGSSDWIKEMTCDV